MFLFFSFDRMQTILAHYHSSQILILFVCAQVIGDLFTAGMETIKTTLEWTVVYMLRNPRVAKAVQEELDQVVGRNRLPTLRDREFLPYTEATILEVLRISSVVPLGSTHAVTRYVCVCVQLSVALTVDPSTRVGFWELCWVGQLTVVSVFENDF